MGYTKTTIKGISWMSGGRFVTRALAFLKIIVLARILNPSQFGIFGIASLILSFLETITETGINIVLIQTKENISEYISTAWVVSIIRGIIIAIFIIISAPFIASFFHTPNAKGVLFFISLVPFVRGFINPAEVKFQKELNFHLQFWFDSTIYIVDALTAIIVSVVTHSVYALGWGLLISAFLEIILSFALIQPRPTFRVEGNYFRDIFHRGIWVTAYTVFNFIAENADNAVVGKFLGATYLGLYQMAYKISIIPITEVSDVVSSVVFPVYTKIAGDSHRLKKAFFKSVITVFLGAFFLGVIIFAFPQQLVLILLGSKWLSIVPVLKILIIYGVIQSVSGPAAALLLSLGRQRYVSAIVFVRFAGLIIFIYPLVKLFGMVGAGYAQLISVTLALPILFALTYVSFKKLKQENASR